MKTMTILTPRVTLKPASKSDLELILAWRSHPLIYKFFRQQTAPLTWKEHINFWQSRLNRKDYIILIKEDGVTRKIGTINFSRLDTQIPEIGILVGELRAHGTGIGSKSLQLGLDWLKRKRYKRVQANINRNNIPSTKIFKSAGFIKNKTDKNKIWINYEKYL